jgi:hypothetical protein
MSTSTAAPIIADTGRLPATAPGLSRVAQPARSDQSGVEGLFT